MSPNGSWRARWGQRRMSSSVASDFDMPRATRGAAQKAAIIAAKLLVTGGCFWYVSRHVDWSQVLSAIPLLDWRWAALAVLMSMLQIPLLGLRWGSIVDVLAPSDKHIARADMMAATAVGVFFAQVLPSVAGEGVRAWLLVRLGSNWRKAVTSAVIDRGVGLAMLMVFGFVILLLPSGLTALGGYRDLVLVVYGALILVGMLGLLLATRIVPLLGRWRYSRWVVIVPISIGGWGLRELAVISLLAGYGVAPERALLFSVCFGLALALGSLPGAVVWLLYPFAPPNSDERAEGEVMSTPGTGRSGAAPDIA